MAAAVPSPGTDAVLTRAEVSQRAALQRRALCVIDNVVYDLSDLLSTHPGGSTVIMEHAGRDASSAFEAAWHAPTVRSRLGKYAVGRIAPSDVVLLGPAS